MSLSLVPLPGSVAFEIRGVDPARLTASDRAALREAFLHHSVLVLRRIPLTPDTQLAMAEAFGEPEIHPIASGRLEGHPAILVPKPYGAPTSDDPEAIIGRIDWHADLTYTTTPPRGALLRAVTIPPEGGQTGFIDTAAVFDALPEAEQARLEPLEAIHDLSRAQRLLGLDMESEQTRAVAQRFPPVAQPLVLHDPVTGRRCLNVSPFFSEAILGLPAAEGRERLRSLTDFATQDRFVYWHQWQQDDLVVWNNYRTLHAAAGHKQKHARTMHRATLAGEAVLGRIPTPAERSGSGRDEADAA